MPKLDRADIDLAQLAIEVTGKIGRPVALSSRPPGQLDEDGKPLDGVLIVTDADTGEVVDVDARILNALVRAHAPKVRPSRADALAKAEKERASGNLDAALGTLLDHLKNGG